MSAYMWPDDAIAAAYQSLAASIVQQAAEDYEEALTTLVRAETRAVRKHGIDSKKEVERFFRSEWYHAVCTLDPVAIIEALKRKVIQRETKIERANLKRALEAYDQKRTQRRK